MIKADITLVNEFQDMYTAGTRRGASDTMVFGTEDEDDETVGTTNKEEQSSLHRCNPTIDWTPKYKDKTIYAHIHTLSPDK